MRMFHREISPLSVSKICRYFTILAVCCCLSSGRLYAQQKKGASRASEETHTLPAKDGWPVAFTYFKPAGASEDTPCVIMLHKENSNRLVWTGFAKRLQSLQYAVFAVDLRKHGESKQGGADEPDKKSRRKKGREVELKKEDYERMIGLDLEALKKFMLEEHQKKNLNIRKTAIIAAQQSAPIAVNYAVYDWLKKPYDDHAVASFKTPRGQDVRALILLSPDEKVPGVSTSRAISLLRNPAWGIATFMAYGTEDSFDNGQTQDMFEKFSRGADEGEERLELHAYKNVKFRGTDLLILGQRRLIPILDQMVRFLDKNLKSLPDKWRDRRSRLRT